MAINDNNVHKAIVVAAILGKDWKFYVWARHWHCFMAMRAAKTEQVNYNSQWFMDASGNFLDRYEARERAAELWQLKEWCSDWDMLFSEDLR